MRGPHIGRVLALGAHWLEVQVWTHSASGREDVRGARCGERSRDSGDWRQRLSEANSVCRIAARPLVIL